jgi:hypothetical protein
VSRIDPWEKAAECTRAMQDTVDPHRERVLHHLAQLWIALGNKACVLSADGLEGEIRKVEELHSDFFKRGPAGHRCASSSLHEGQHE